jgi:hypothetical protein
MAAIAQIGNALKYCSAELEATKEVLMAAVATHGHVLK